MTPKQPEESRKIETKRRPRSGRRRCWAKHAAGTSARRNTPPEHRHGETRRRNIGTAKHAAGTSARRNTRPAARVAVITKKNQIIKKGKKTMKTTFFKNPETLEELKKQFKELAQKHHPDKNPSDRLAATERFKILKNEYDYLFEVLKDVHTNAKGEKYTSSKKTTETPETFRDIIENLIHFEGIIIEIIGTFIWCSGNTFPYRENFKKLKFLYSGTKKAWYLKPEDYVKIGKRKYSLENIREMFGSEEIETVTTAKIG